MAMGRSVKARVTKGDEGVTLKEDSRKGSRFLRVVERLIADVENKLRRVLNRV
jgi:hypothetical protein